MKILVFVPCYNCEIQIARTLKDLDGILSLSLPIQAIYVIDNQSPDASVKSALQTISQLTHKEKFKVYRNYENAGLGGSHKIAFSLANESEATHLLVFHGDHQASAEDIPALIQGSLAHNEITTLGSRFTDLSRLSGYSVVRKFGNLFLNLIYSVFTATGVSDLGSGLNLFKIQDLPNSDLQNFDNGFTFNMDLLLYLIRHKKAFQYISIKWSTVDQISNAHSIKVGLKTLSKLINWRLHRPVKNQHHSRSELITSTK